MNPSYPPDDSRSSDAFSDPYRVPQGPREPQSPLFTPPDLPQSPQPITVPEEPRAAGLRTTKRQSARRQPPRTQGNDTAPEARVLYRGANNDQAFGFLIAIAVSIGLTPWVPDSADMRYTVVWGVLALFGVLAWLLGGGARIGQEALDNLVWGVVFGMIISIPLLLVGGGTLNATVQRLFPNMGDGTLLAYVIFVMPLGETLFFRGVLQQNYAFWVVGLLASVWSVLLFFPMLDLVNYPAVALVIGVALVMVNTMYSYVRQRSGLAAAWLCQIVASIILFFLPFVGAI